MEARGGVVVTGASSGIGWATALVLARRRWLVFAGVRREADGEALLAAAGVIGAGELIRAVALDVTDEASVAKMAEEVGAEIARRGVHLVGLVNNAGIAVAGPVEEVPLTRLRAVLEVNVVGVVATTQALLPLLRAGRGRIVNVSSVSGRIASPFLGAYAASKFALEALSDSLRVELRPWGLAVVLVEPGPVGTPIWGKGMAMAMEDRAGLDDSSPYAPYLDRVRMALRAGTARGITPAQVAELIARRLSGPEEVAAVIAHALSVAQPRVRYPVGRNRVAAGILARLVPDGVRDWLMTRRA